jgi:hypothetical protein
VRCSLPQRLRTLLLRHAASQRWAAALLGLAPADAAGGGGEGAEELAAGPDWRLEQARLLRQRADRSAPRLAAHMALARVDQLRGSQQGGSGGGGGAGGRLRLAAALSLAGCWCAEAQVRGPEEAGDWAAVLQQRAAVMCCP